MVLDFLLTSEEYRSTAAMPPPGLVRRRRLRGARINLTIEDFTDAERATRGFRPRAVPPCAWSSKACADPFSRAAVLHSANRSGYVYRMLTLILAVGIPLLAAATVWIWYCRDTGTHDQPPFGEPKFTDDPDRPRPERA